jgi:tRNA (cmo5U34)-methyltransferase
MNRSKYDLERPENYDSLLPLVIPSWELYYGTVAEYIGQGARRILELASGTGILTTIIKKKRPGSDIVCIDKNPEMLIVARKKPELREVTFIEGDILEEWPEGPFDAVVTTQCLFSFSAAKRGQIAKKAYHTLSDGGVFLNGDMFHPGNDWEFAVYTSRLKKFMCDNGLSEDVADMMLGPLDPMIRDHTASDFCSILRRVGFSRTAIPYRNGLYGIVLGIRSGEVSTLW